MELNTYIWYFELYSTNLCKTLFKIISVSLSLKVLSIKSCIVVSLRHLLNYFRVRLFSRAFTLRKTLRIQSFCSAGSYAARGRCFCSFAASPQCCWSTRSAFDCCRTQWRTEQGSRCSTEDNNTWTGWIPGVTRSAAAYLWVQHLKLALLCTTSIEEDAAAAIFCYFLAYLCPNTEQRS